jgi:chromosome segregation ATPase
VTSSVTDSGLQPLLSPALLTVEQLQQELINVRQQRDQARWEASNWRQRYEMEAQQRRAESAHAEQAIATLKAQLHSPATGADTLDPTILESLQTKVAAETDTAALQALLLAALTEQQQLRQALQAEQASHAKTRHSLTNALGDAIDVFSRRRKRQSKPASL